MRRLLGLVFFLASLLLSGLIVPFITIVLDNAPFERFGSAYGVAGTASSIGAISVWFIFRALTPGRNIFAIELTIAVAAMLAAAVLMVFVQNQLGNPKGDLVEPEILPA